ncbi:hypothetical protein PPACK8108_LOCUS3526 [Phakopsora pachyrhizi]|uniref:Uncharacterized protein n=1 Tax=Phakopsora pachyrhizi TaxID=170000 RepID=A0AAV0ANV5_PHAPC|nr:hypothetical protein PPACK8108_LOCUS3526 [Phakopsora pachyrhizi]
MGGSGWPPEVHSWSTGSESGVRVIRRRKKREKWLLDSNLGKRCLRLLIDLIVLNLDLAQELYASDNDSTKTGEDEVCCGQTSFAEHSKQSNCTRINKGTSSNNWLKSNKFKVFEDGKDDHQIEIPGLMTKWDDLRTVKSNQRPNLIEPTTWKIQKLLVDD